jgi:16S rRNA (uracil1498-N3)-methyltransferase
MVLFFTPDIISGVYTLNEEESRHCRMVLRMQNGEIVHLTDGKGTLFKSRIVDASGKHVVVEVIERQDEYNKRQYRLHLAVAPTKNTERFEWFLEKATEIGVDIITPVICEHSERRVLRTDRLNKVITAAVKQSLKTYHPFLKEPVEFKNFLKENKDDQLFIAHLEEDSPILLKDIYKKGANATIIIGPEGDFSEMEIINAKKINYSCVSLGNSRLRTETAAVAACHTIFLLNQ